MLYPAFLARSHIVTCVLAQKKKFKRIFNYLFGGRRKVHVTNLLSRTSSSVVASAANSVGKTLEFAAFRRGPDPKS